jgi:hypothetical protein
VLWIEMLDEHKCHPAIRWHILEKRREGIQSACGCADPNDQPARFSRSGGDNLGSYSDLLSDQGLLGNITPGLSLSMQIIWKRRLPPVETLPPACPFRLDGWTLRR